MLSKKYRLPIQSFIKRTGKIKKSRHFLLKIFNSNNSYSRVGIVIGKKVAVKSTHRNILKRIVFNFFRENISGLPANDYLVIVLPGSAEINKGEFLQELIKTLNPKP